MGVLRSVFMINERFRRNALGVAGFIGLGGLLVLADGENGHDSTSSKVKNLSLTPIVLDSTAGQSCTPEAVYVEAERSTMDLEGFAIATSESISGKENVVVILPPNDSC